jgi:hypothetical protein
MPAMPPKVLGKAPGTIRGHAGATGRLAERPLPPREAACWQSCWRNFAMNDTDTVGP